MSVWKRHTPSRALMRYAYEIDGRQLNIGTFVVKPFDVPHMDTDGKPCENYGFLIYSKVTKEKMLWITDCAYIEHKFPPCDYICIECNYIDIDDYAKDAPYLNMAVESRRVQSHLSLHRSIAFVKRQNRTKLKQIRLLHISKSHGNIKNIMLSEFKKKFPHIDIKC